MFRMVLVEVQRVWHLRLAISQPILGVRSHWHATCQILYQQRWEEYKTGLIKRSKGHVMWQLIIDPILNKFSPDLVAQIDLASLATRGHHTQITSFSRVFKPPTMADLPSPSIKYHHSNLANNTIQPSTTPAHTTRHHRLAFPGFYHRRMMSYRRHHHTNKILHIHQQ